MKTKKGISMRVFAAFVFFSLAAAWTPAQTATAQSRITAPVDDTKLTVLAGNTHPLARPQFDRGQVAASLPMEHMLLVLKRSSEQQAALDKLLDEQQDRSSPNYHKWLTPDDFGQQFGASEKDIQAITSWLQSHGFQVNSAVSGHNLIDFSGTAAQVQAAFHTEIHRYVFNNGEEHWSNANDPAIPTALTPVIIGVRSLNNFFPKPLHHMAPTTKARISGALRPQYTFPIGCTTATTCEFGIGPADFAKIYSVPSQATGSGETIAVVSGSDIVASDLTQFRGVFGLPSITINTANSTACAVSPCFTQVTPSGSGDPGVAGPKVNGGPDGDEDEIEAILDVEWSGAVAPGANIDLVASADTNSTAGIDQSAMYIVNYNGKTGLAPILSESYGVCELGAGTTGSAFYNTLWSQAASEGITVIVSAGDNGSAACDTEEANGTPTQPAVSGLEVNAIASTPYNIAVGATDFNDLNNPFTYFGTSAANNTTTGLSAKSYIPETTWNDSCTNSVIYSLFSDTSAQAACNDSNVQVFENQDDIFLVAPVGGSGGMSTCTSSNGSNPATCSGGYAKPSWQTGPGVPTDGRRDIPDVSLFGADGFVSGSFYIDCEADLPNANNQPTGPCNLAGEDFGGFGGTSVSAQAFAGIMALIDQSTKSAEGNANPVFYALAAEQSSSTCVSSSTLTSSTSSACPFNDVTVGTIAMPCEAKATNSEPIVSPDCPLVSSEAIGILTVPTSVTATAPTLAGPGYNAAAGYDLATGLGTPNVLVLLGELGPNFYISAASPTVTVSQGSSQALTLTVTGVNLTGPLVVNGFSCPVLPSLATCTFTTNPVTSPASVTLTPGSPTQTVTVMVTTTPATSAVPALKLPNVNRWTLGQIIVFTCFLCTGAMLIRMRRRPARWSMAFAVIAFAGIISCAACGGGGSSSGGGGGGGGGGTGGTPKGTTTATVTATNGTVTTTMNFTLTVD